LAKIFATDRDGTKYEVAGRDRASLMEILRQAGLSIEALESSRLACQISWSDDLDGITLTVAPEA